MTVQSKSDLAGMRAVGKLVGQAIVRMRAALAPGMTTEQLDDVGAKFLHRHGARSAPQLTYAFPGFNCISVNDEVVHGVPGRRTLMAGDIVKIDVTAELGGYIADSACSAIIPPTTPAANNLVRCAQAAFKRGLKTAIAGVRIAEVGRAVETEVNRWGCAVIRELCGHGVGRRLHESPAVPNYFSVRTPGSLALGMVIALEPIIAERPTAVYEAADGWTIRTATGSLAAHYEHTIVIGEGRAEILTAA